MRYFILLGFLLLLFSKPVTAQAPNQFNFQGVLRNTSNQLLSNVSVGMRVTILLGSSSGTVVYQETYSPNPKTNDNGLITLEVGTGVVLLGNFSAIDWSAGSYYIRTEADPGGGNLYSIQGVAQLLSVPYALYSQTAKTAPTVKLNDLLDVNTNGVTAGQVVKWNGTVWSAADDLAGAGGSDNWGTQTVVSNSSLSGNGTASFPLILASQGASNGQVLKWSGSGWAPQNDADAQALTIAGQTLSISGGNSVTIPSGADNSPTNEIQSLTLNGGNLTLSLGGGTVFLPDNSPFNELQVLNLNGNTLSLLPAGGSVTLSNNQWGTFGDDIVNTNIGSVGIGTGNPASKLHVYASTGSGIRGEAVSGFGIYGKSNAGSGVVGESIELSGVSGNSTNGNGGFFRTTNGVALRAEGKVVLTGFVGIGTEDPTQNLSVNGTAGKPGGGSWLTFSDSRLKNQVKPYQQGLKELMKVNPVSYHYNGKLDLPTEPQYIGVIAQDLQKISPDMVKSVATKSGTDKATDYLEVDPSAFTYMLINAVKEQQQTIEELKAGQAALLKEIEALKKNLKK